MKRHSIDRSWYFLHGKIEQNARGDRNPSARTVNLPHDFTIETDPYPESPGGRGTGFYGGGVGTYTKIIDIPEDWRGRRVIAEFDGAYMHTVVELNGQSVAEHHYGYTPFHADLTSYIKPGRANRLTVVVNNSALPNSRWYSGSGLYRHVDLLEGPQIHIAPWGIYAYTDHIKDGTAYVTVETTVENHTAAPAKCRVEISAAPEGGTPDKKGKTAVWVPAGKQAKARIQIAIENAGLWDTDSPNLYTLSAELTDADGTLDADSIPFGIRTISVDVKNGFMLNGRSMKLKGGCIHHDNGLLGAASFRDSEYRKLKLHKENGYNAIRCAHNPPSRDMLDACDRLGLLVMDEAFDCWLNGKNTNDYHLFFETHWKDDIKAMMMRDRNHPCIIMWSTGNEVTERAGLSNGFEWSAKLAEYVRSLDPTRFVTNAIPTMFNGLDDEDQEKNEEDMKKRRAAGLSVQNFNSSYSRRIWADYTEAFCAPLDVVGYNYLYTRYEEDGKLFPNRVICGTESTAKDLPTLWHIINSCPHVIGDFTWTSYDYIGEAGIGNCTYVDPDSEMNALSVMRQPIEHPWRLANDADFDICGFDRPQLHYRQVTLDSSETYIAVQDPKHFGMQEIISAWGWPVRANSWNWKGHEGGKIHIDVYSSAEEVELLINGKSIGKAPSGFENKFTAAFDTVYEPGTVTAISYTDGKEVSRSSISTVGEPAGIKLIPERDCMPADGQSLAFVTVEIVDSEGRRVPDAEKLIKASVEGAAALAAFGSARPVTTENYTTGSFTSYEGRAQAILRADYEAGEAVLNVQAEGFAPVKLVIPVG